MSPARHSQHIHILPLEHSTVLRPAITFQMASRPRPGENTTIVENADL